MDKLSTAVPSATVGAVRGVTEVKFSRPLPSSSFSIENLIAVKQRRRSAGGSSPEIDPVEQGSDCSPPPPGLNSAAGALFLEGTPQQQYLAAAAAAGYSAAMLSFSSFPPLYHHHHHQHPHHHHHQQHPHPWSTAIVPGGAGGRYLSQAANEKLSTLLFHHSSGGHKSQPGGGEPAFHVPHEPPGAASPRGARSGDKLFPIAADTELLSKVYAAYQQHQPAGPFPGAPLEPVPSANVPQHQLQQQDTVGDAGRTAPTPEDDERTRPMEDGGDSADGSAYSDDISLSLSPSGCGKTAVCRRDPREGGFVFSIRELTFHGQETTDGQ
uniref:Uncharacterized protein n=1 Tax=Anopheles dirus TaxID=7168 RepID=A0A182N9C5_9DIPT